MIRDLHDILLLLGVPRFFISIIVLSCLLISGTLIVEHIINIRENQLKTTVQYVPESRKMDSLILNKVTCMESKFDGKFDSIDKNIHVMSAVIKSYNDINAEKFNILIRHNSELRSSFKAMDRNLNCVINLLPLAQKNKSQFPVMANNY